MPRARAGHPPRAQAQAGHRRRGSDAAAQLPSGLPDDSDESDPLSESHKGGKARRDAAAEILARPGPNRPGLARPGPI